MAVYDFDGQVVGRLDGHRNWVLSIALDEEESTVASAGEDREIILWDLETLAVRHRLISPKHSAAEHLCFWTADDGTKYLFSGHRDGTILRWNLETMELEQTISAFGSLVSGLQLVDDRLVATSSASTTLKFFDVADGKTVAELPISERPVEFLKIAQDSRRIWIGHRSAIEMHTIGETAPTE